MKKSEYIHLALGEELYKERAWVISAFAVIQEEPNAYKKQPYPYRIVQTPTGTYFVDKHDNTKLILLEDAVPGEPPFSKAELLELKAGQVPNLKEDLITSYGNLVANYILLVFPFGDIYPYMNGIMKTGGIEDIIVSHFYDEPETEEEKRAIRSKDPQAYFYDSYLRYTHAVDYITGFASMWNSGGSFKNQLAPPGIAALKKQLLEKYKDKLDDQATIAVIMAELKQADLEWLADDEAMNILIKKKSFDVIRAKKYLMVGAEAGLGDGLKVELIQNSLSEGWDINSIPAMVNNLRAGSFNRGAETVLGGVVFKDLLRATNTVTIKPGDCGSKIGLETVITDFNKKSYNGFTIIHDSGEQELITPENVGKYLGKKISVRSMVYCKLPFTDYCACCAGPLLAANPAAASIAVADYGSAMLLMFMKANHGKALNVAKYNYKERLT
jgi:hypothetical protein